MTATEAVASALALTGVAAAVLAIIFGLTVSDMWRGPARERLKVAAWVAVSVAVMLLVSAAWVGFMGAIE